MWLFSSNPLGFRLLPTYKYVVTSGPMIACLLGRRTALLRTQPIGGLGYKESSLRRDRTQGDKWHLQACRRGRSQADPVASCVAVGCGLWGDDSANLPKQEFWRSQRSRQVPSADMGHFTEEVTENANYCASLWSYWIKIIWAKAWGYSFLTNFHVILILAQLEIFILPGPLRS